MDDLQLILGQYFPQCQEGFKIISQWQLSHQKQHSWFERLIDFTTESSIKQKFKELLLNEFWISLSEEYPNLSKWATRVLLPFVTMYLCKAGFSHNSATNSKYRNQLDAASDIRIHVSNIVPNIKRICNSKTQTHWSYWKLKRF